MNETIALIAKGRKWRQLSRTIRGEPPSFEVSLLEFFLTGLCSSISSMLGFTGCWMNSWRKIRRHLTHLSFPILHHVSSGFWTITFSTWVITMVSRTPCLLPPQHYLLSTMECDPAQNSSIWLQVDPKIPVECLDSEGLEESCPSPILCQPCFPSSLPFPWPPHPAVLWRK